MKIMVTGGAGFIASHVVDAYRAQGHDVFVVDSLVRGRRENLSPEVRLYACDICDAKALEEVIQREKPDVINHHAAQMDVRRAVEEPVYDAQVNIIGSIHLLDLSVRYKVKRWIYVSTAGAAYGEPRQLPVPEDHAVNPITPYGISKHTVEHYLFTYHFNYNLPYVVLRYGNVYGPRQSSKGESGVFAVFSEKLLAGARPTIFGDGTKTRDYVYIDDVARANVLALERGEGESMNIGSGIATTDFRIFSLIRAAIGSPLEPIYAPRRPGEIEHICMQISKAGQVLGWTPAVSLEIGAQRTVDYFKRTWKNIEA